MQKSKHVFYFFDGSYHAYIKKNIWLQRSNITNTPETPVVPTLCTKDLAKEENYKDALKISVQDADEHQPPLLKTPEGKEMASTHQNSEEQPRRHNCLVDLNPHLPRPAGLPSLGNVGRGEPRACPSHHAAGTNQQGRW
jgi:hypothetical protein